MQNRKINCTVVCLEIVAAWVLLGGYELHVWFSDGTFPPSPIMNFVLVSLATVTVVYSIARTSSSARSNFELGREVERVVPNSRSGLRSVDEMAR